MKYFCNPVNMEYRYQMFQIKGQENLCEAHREAADPSIIYFKGRYYLFPSMSAGFYTSENLAGWEFHAFSGDIPIYDYAPGIRVVGDYVYCCASSHENECSFYRTKDPLTEPFEEIKGSFRFWDPNLLCDDDGRLYLYWGSSNSEPICGVELDPKTMRPLGEKTPLLEAHEDVNGFERMGEDYVPPKTEEEIQEAIAAVLKEHGQEGYEPDEAMKRQFYKWFGNSPYMEGPWMTKHDGKYYLQYAVTGTEYNVYADGVYVADSPLGPFTLAKNNPYSYKPGGFVTGAGHGSTFEDGGDGFWHVSTMRISVNQSFERRLGIWRAQFDEDGELCCDQRYGDWPMRADAKIWDKPEWMLLSFGKPVKASSGRNAEKITDEDIRTWWQAETSGKEEWAEIDLEKVMDVRAVQINFADDCQVEVEPGTYFFTSWDQKRRIDETRHVTRWILEGSVDGVHYEILEDKSRAETDLSHDLVVWEEGKQVRYLRVRAMELPYGQRPCISGLRAFGLGKGKKPRQVETFTAAREQNGMDMRVSWERDDAVGHNILWGHAPDKLYHGHMVYGKSEQNIGALVCGSDVYVRIDAFNENGITEGVTRKA